MINRLFDQYFDISQLYLQKFRSFSEKKCKRVWGKNRIANKLPGYDKICYLLQI